MSAWDSFAFTTSSSRVPPNTRCCRLLSRWTNGSVAWPTSPLDVRPWVTGSVPTPTPPSGPASSTRPFTHHPPLCACLAVIHPIRNVGHRTFSGCALWSSPRGLVFSTRDARLRGPRGPSPGPLVKQPGVQLCRRPTSVSLPATWLLDTNLVFRDADGTWTPVVYEDASADPSSSRYWWQPLVLESVDTAPPSCMDRLYLPHNWAMELAMTLRTLPPPHPPLIHLLRAAHHLPGGGADRSGRHHPWKHWPWRFRTLLENHASWYMGPGLRPMRA